MFGAKKKKAKRSRKNLPAGRQGLEWHTDYELTERVRGVINELEFAHIPKHRIFCFRTEGSKARAYARIWAFPKIFQTVLDIEPAYVIEVLNKYYNSLDHARQTKVIIHELLHIPKNFSGALLPHKHRERTIDKEVERLYRNLRKE